MKPRHFLFAGLGVVAVGLIGFVAFAWRSELPPRAVPKPHEFADDLVRRGAELAAIGNCNVCHTRQGGEVFAGGLPLPTPFGTIFATNITPDPETGIGQWTEAAFIRAMREGVDRKGRHLYPAFPYDHFAKVTDDDNRALYAYLMTRKPVRAQTPANELPFPLNVRMILAGWKLLFFQEGAYRRDSTQTAEWNRGAYLADGLGHCGACHTPRNRLGAEIRDQQFAGGEAEGWTAYALNEASPAPVKWTVDSLTHYLRNGWEEQHGVARGPMAPVTANMMSASPENARAIATYVASIMGPPNSAAAAPTANRPTAGNETRPDKARDGPDTSQAVITQTAGGQTATPSFNSGNPGEALYASACSSCHDAGRPVPYGGLPLRLSTATHGPTPLNPINVVLYGLPAPEGQKGPIMPGFAGSMTDTQIAQLLAYIRSTFSDKPEWTDIEASVTKVRATHDPELRSLSTGSSAPANPSRRETTW